MFINLSFIEPTLQLVKVRLAQGIKKIDEKMLVFTVATLVNG